VIEIAEMIGSPEPSRLVTLCRQMGVDHAVGGLGEVDHRGILGVALGHLGG